MVARAPAKAILSGEHSVVYGMPALALALPLYATVTFSRGTSADQIELVLSDLNKRIELDPLQLGAFQQQCEQRYQCFVAGELAIEAVLPNPSDLYHYALSLWPDAAESLVGYRIELTSMIEIGSGMGSSAATVSALLTAMSGQFKQPLPIDELIELTTRCERLQHGRSSGLDPAVCSRGGLIQFQQGVTQSLPVALDHHWYRVDSGRPQTTTGRCTSQVRQQFGDSDIWSEFGDITRQLALALQRRNTDQIVTTLRHNHRLLCRIGVVPEPVQRFVAAVAQRGGAAKISGSGAISGDQGGMVLVYYPDDRDLDTAVLGYDWQKMEMDRNGAQLRN
ncbi:MAG: hypothetical protein V7752_20010 [Halopseudomonas sp.]